MPAATKQKTSSFYDVHPSLGMYRNSLATLKQKTGRSLEEWIKFVNKEGPPTEKERRAWLKEKHGLGMNYAWWIAERSLGKGRRWLCGNLPQECRSVCGEDVLRPQANLAPHL